MLYYSLCTYVLYRCPSCLSHEEGSCGLACTFRTLYALYVVHTPSAIDRRPQARRQVEVGTCISNLPRLRLLLRLRIHTGTLDSTSRLLPYSIRWYMCGVLWCTPAAASGVLLYYTLHLHSLTLLLLNTRIRSVLNLLFAVPLLESKVSDNPFSHG